jgi:hypothetical protein
MSTDEPDAYYARLINAAHELGHLCVWRCAPGVKIRSVVLDEGFKGGSVRANFGDLEERGLKMFLVGTLAGIAAHEQMEDRFGYQRTDADVSHDLLVFDEWRRHPLAGGIGQAKFEYVAHALVERAAEEINRLAPVLAREGQIDPADFDGPWFTAADLGWLNRRSA